MNLNELAIAPRVQVPVVRLGRRARVRGFFPWLGLATYLAVGHTPDWMWFLIWFPALVGILWIYFAVAKIDQSRGWLLVGGATFVAEVSAILGGFAGTYYVAFGNKGFGDSLSRMDTAYFTVGVFTTVGSGFAAMSTAAEAVVIAQMLTTLVIVTVLLAYMIGKLGGR
jgi:hypothetical protein